MLLFYALLVRYEYFTRHFGNVERLHIKLTLARLNTRYLKQRVDKAGQATHLARDNAEIMLVFFRRNGSV